jgi:hypothetical protein
MKTQFFRQCLLGTILVLALTVPVMAEASTISSISPSQGYTGKTTSTITITGTNFNASSVRLMMDGVSNITGITISSRSSTTIKCSITISSTATIGTWDVVVINKDGSESVKTNAFTIRKTMTLTSVSPKSAQTNNDSVQVSVVGTGLSDVDRMYLYSSGHDNITAVIDDTESTKVKGTFDLTGADIDTYEICVADAVDTIKCDLSFDVLSDKVGSVDVESSPSGAKVYLDSDYVGTTPYTIEDVSLGSHKITISKTGYVDYIKWVTVKVDSTSSVSADLDAVATAATTGVQTVATTKTPLKVTTVKVPTSWPTPATTQTSLDATLVLGAIALGVLVLYRK